MTSVPATQPEANVCRRLRLDGPRQESCLTRWKAVASGVVSNAQRECAACGSSLPGGRARFCDDCKRARTLYTTTKNNLASGFNRTGPAPALEMTIDEFCIWRKSVSQECHYCGIAETDLLRVGMKSQIQRDVKTMGVDRLDSSGGYAVGNIAPCCFVRNQVKGNRFSEEEMRIVAPGIAAVWRARLGMPLD